MVLKPLVLILILNIFMIDAVSLVSKPQIRKQQNQNRVCYNVTVNPFYLKMAVIGKPWHAYYTWNGQFKDMCLKTIFKVPDKMIVRFLKHKFYGLSEEPTWSKAELLMYMGDCKQMVLFKDRSGVPGQFDGLPYYKRKDFPHELPVRRPYKMTMKVINRGKYLLMSDCTSGVTTLLLHPENRPKRVEIEAFAAKFDFGDPFPACIKEPDPLIKNVTIEVITEASTVTVKNTSSKYDW